MVLPVVVVLGPAPNCTDSQPASQPAQFRACNVLMFEDPGI
jgi:hypothetical protein